MGKSTLAPEWHPRPAAETASVPGDPIPGLLVNQNADPGLGARILDLIQAARPGETLLLISPLVQDRTVLEALLAARRRKVVVRLLTELRGDRKKDYLMALDAYGFTKAQREQASKEHLRALGQLGGGQVGVRGFWFNSHAKLIILGEQAAVVSSANLTTNSLGRGEPSVEIGVEINTPEILSALRQTFQALWNEAPSVLDSFVDERQAGYSVQSRPSSLPNVSPFTEIHRGGIDILWNVPGVASPIAPRLVEAIEAARESIVLGTYSFYDLDQGLPRLEAALLAALHRKVAVTLVVRPDEYALDPSTSRLVDAGMVMLGLSGLHAKAVRVDRSFCLLTSANLNRFSLAEHPARADRPSLENRPNLELALAASADAGLLAPVAAWCDRLVAGASHRWVKSG